MITQRRSLSMVLIALMVWSICAISAEPAAAASQLKYKVSYYGEEMQKEAYKILALTNKERAKAGSSTVKLEWDRDLEEAAQIRAKELAFYYNSAKRPDGTDWYSVSKKVGGVNVAVSDRSRTAEDVNDLWTGSKACNDQRTAEKYRSYGAAAIKTEHGRIYWVELFSTQKSSNVSNSNSELHGPKTIQIIDDTVRELSYRLEEPEGQTAAIDHLKIDDQLIMKLKSLNTSGIGDEEIIVSNPAGNHFTSSNPAVATVDATGLITCNAAGMTIITGKLHPSSEKQTSVTLNVSDEDISEPVTMVFKDGNSIIGTQTISSGGTITPPSPKKDGYKFVGWYTEETDGEAVTDFSNLTENKTVYARFEKNEAPKVIVTFMNGSKIAKVETVISGDSATAPKVSKTGYTFLGWYTEKSGGSKITGFDNVTTDITAYARFAQNPGKPTVSLKSPKKKQLKVSYSKVKRATKYQVYYGTSSGKITKSLYTGTKTSVTKTLSSKKTYYVKVRAYTTVSGVKCYGAWSTPKKIKLK